MADKYIERTSDVLRTGLGQNGKLIVDSTHSLISTSETFRVMQVIDDITITSITDSSLDTSGASFPTTVVAGSIIYGSFIAMAVSTGTVILYK